MVEAPVCAGSCSKLSCPGGQSHEDSDAGPRGVGSTILRSSGLRSQLNAGDCFRTPNAENVVYRRGGSGSGASGSYLGLAFPVGSLFCAPALTA